MPKLDLTSLLSLLPIVGPAIAATKEFSALYHAGVELLHPADQTTAKSAYQDIIANNAEGHVRLQAKLAEAGQR